MRPVHWTLEKIRSHCIVTPSGCWGWQRGCSTRPDGSVSYGSVTIKSRAQKVHRLVWTLATGEVLPPDVQICHHCDNPPCCNFDHMFKGDNSTNQLDAVAKGRHYVPFGTRHPLSKLTEEQAIAIRERVAQGERQMDLAAEMGVSKSLVCMVVSRKVWTHV